MIKQIQLDKTQATSQEDKPRLNNPFPTCFRYIVPIRIGIPYERYSPTIAIEVAAEKATYKPRDGIARRKDSPAARRTARVGICIRLVVRAKNRGIPESRAKLNIILEFNVIEKSPQCQIHKVISVISTVVPSLPKISSKIWTTGWPSSLWIVLLKFWIENRSDRSRRKPNRAEATTAIIIPRGTFSNAFRVSLEK